MSGKILRRPMEAAKPVNKTRAIQSLIDLPEDQAPEIKVAITPPTQSLARVNQTLMPICWGLITASTAILILEIWNYLS